MADGLIRKRAAVKSKLTVFTNYFNALKARIQDDTLDEQSYLELEHRFERFQGIIEDFDEAQLAVELEVGPDDLNAQLAERESFEGSYFCVVAAARGLLNKNAPAQVATNGSGTSKSEAAGSVLRSQFINSNHDAEMVGSGAASSVAAMNFQGVKLPTIQLPKFDGKYEDWLEYRDTFESLIHNNGVINDVQKFHYLRASLQGGATQIIKSLEFSAANYKVAWDALCDRYDNKKLLLNNHVKALFNVESIAKESAGQLRKIVDNVNKHLRALESLQQPTSEWDVLVIYLIVIKLDAVSVREWEEKRETEPRLKDLMDFLKKRADLLETLEVNRSEKRSARPVESRSLVTTQECCALCKGGHMIINCGDFLKLGVGERMEKVKGLRLCVNCLKQGHMSFNCFKKWGCCKKCKGKHHALLHFDKESSKNQVVAENSEPNAVKVTLSSLRGISEVLLTTAIVDVLGRDFKYYKTRVLLDAGSQSSFISEEFCNVLNLKKVATKLKISGFGQSTSNVTRQCEVELISRINNFKIKVSCLISPTITSSLPNFNLDRSQLCIPSNIQLADPNFYVSSKVDMLLGADCFWELLCVGQIKCGNAGPYLQKTKFGWVLGGPIHSSFNANESVCNLISTDIIDDRLKMFWEVEDYSIRNKWSKEEQACEEHFKRNTERDDNGRFVVSLPLKENPNKLGDSRLMAEKRFMSLEKKLLRDENLRIRYVNFMEEYQRLGHMKVVEQIPGDTSYYMPHHAVLKEDSSTTKLRVVFDASAPSSTGMSLNQIQMVGPTIQDDLFSILIRFRKHAFVIKADVEKMYRQVLVKPEDRSLQRILWRDCPSKTIQTFEMSTVTYGQAASSFLAIRSLQQAAINVEEEFPLESKVIREDFYVDDLLTGANSALEAVEIGLKIRNILERACFNLRKWFSNDVSILSQLDGESISTMVRMGADENSKTLGLFWEAQKDNLLYTIADSKFKKITKRTILSDISQIFDPLGLLSPCIITAKVMLQKIWLEKIAWDESLPFDLHSQWLFYRDELLCLSNLRIPRIAFCLDSVEVQFHGFCDASEKAYGASVYIRSINAEDKVFVNLLCAKSKVAPLKMLTIPRLELCGALLLAKLIVKVKKALNKPDVKCTFWTDSTIVLGWLKMSPHALQVFVGNRAAQIQELTNTTDWKHVSSHDNPADHISRGVRPSLLAENEIWWYGPKWLACGESSWPINDFNTETLPELRKIVATNVAVVSKGVEFSNYSSLTNFERIIAYCLRFIKNCSNKNSRLSGALTINEINSARDVLIKFSQNDTFSKEIAALKANKSFDKSNLINLNPFLDKKGILRVGGRLSNSNFPYKKRHPAVLSSKHDFTKLLFRREHLRLLHAGSQHLLSVVREQFWPLGGRNLARKTVRDCIRCFRVKPNVVNPIMGNLPLQRVVPSPPFFSTGVDFAGPILIRETTARRARKFKGYIAVFVCFCTKAVHLELVLSLTSEAFIASLRRFCSRRGKPHDIFSDNGTNFVGADSELKELGKFLKKTGCELDEFAENEGIQWHFIPPSAPHFGGLWEASVKATKFHLKRVVGDASLTIEQLTTLLCQIESVLNSRPMHPLSSDPHDLSALSPAHFLIGRPLTSIADPDLMKIPDNRLSHWQRIQQLNQHFWSRWSKEYISELQQRSRWKRSQSPIRIGDLVLVKDDNLPPLKWRLGRVTSLCPGKDNVSRVVFLKTANGDLKRPVAKLCVLPSASADMRDEEVTVKV